MTPLAVPVMAVCLLATTPEVDDAAHSTVLRQELLGCTVCNVGDCNLPPDFERLARELNRPAPPPQAAKRR